MRARGGLVLVAYVATFTGCPAPAVPAPPAPHALQWKEQVDWPRAHAEAVADFQAYLRVDTTNPPGREAAGVEWIRSRLAEDGIPAELIEFAPGRPNLVARLPASVQPPAAGPLCLLSHVDVVTAEAGDWPADRGPQSGTLDTEGVIWGRGALDMKGLGLLQLETMRWLKRLGVPLNREVILIAVGDEEVHNAGMRELADKHWDKLRCEHVLNEGGMGVRDLLVAGQSVFTISTAEKGVAWIRMTARGEAGHGSTPIPDRAPERLIRAMAAIQARRGEPRPGAFIHEVVRRVGAHQGGLAAWLTSTPGLVVPWVVRALGDRPEVRAVLTDTTLVTGMSGGETPNVVPAQMHAMLDCRLLPGSRLEDLLAELAATTGNDPALSFEVTQHHPALESPWQDAFFEALAAHAVHRRPDAVAVPITMMGFSDSLWARQHGARAYGFTPFLVERQDLATMHGRGERVSAENVHRGLEVVLGAVLQVAARP